MYKSIIIVSIFLIICLVNGEHNPNSEVEHLDTGTGTLNLKDMLKKVSDETKKLREFLDSTKKNTADGEKSDSNISKLLGLPKEVADLANKIQSTINELEKKELLA
nr:uncharacterized protein LOC106691049 [Halyomorpha halys]